MTVLRTISRRDFLQTTSAGTLACGLRTSVFAAPKNADAPALLARRESGKMRLFLDKRTQDGGDVAAQSVRLAAERLRHVAREQLRLEVDIRTEGAGEHEGGVIAACAPWEAHVVTRLEKANLKVGADGLLSAFDKTPASRSGQAFAAARLGTDSGDRLVLAANEPQGLRNALLTLTDRLYLDADKNVVVDPFWGVHVPALATRHLKTDAMNCGRFRARLEYWDPTCTEGIQAFADWIASFRLTDYDLLAFMRGWGATYASERFPNLADPQHPNVTLDFYPQLIDRLHCWGMRVWAADIYLASGYTMEVGTEPRMLSPQANASKLRPFKAGVGTFSEILSDPQAIACLSHPAAAEYYAHVVDDLLAHYPKLDGLNFHIGHAFPSKICRCPKCKDLTGNRESVHRCFARAYEAAVARRPNVRITLAVKMFGDATRRIVERAADFPGLELFCWLRWLSNWAMERADAPVTFGHEDGGGGLEAGNYEGNKPLAQVREYFRDYEYLIQSYVNQSRQAGLVGVSWETQLHRELDNQFFFYSQLSWEPDLTWKELARRYVIRSERALNDRLVEAYQLALEANAAISYWGAAPTSQGVVQSNRLLETAFVGERLAALGEALSKLGLEGRHDMGRGAKPAPPVAFDLRRSLVQTYRRMKSNKVASVSH